jgi:hypothetical protein
MESDVKTYHPVRPKLLDIERPLRPGDTRNHPGGTVPSRARPGALRPRSFTVLNGEPSFHPGLQGHRFIRFLEGAYPYTWASHHRGPMFGRMLPLDTFPETTADLDLTSGGGFGDLP